MNNVMLTPEFYDDQIIYDLKGSTYKRLTKPEKVKSGAAQKDLNYIQNK